MRFMWYSNVYAIRTLESIHFTFSLHLVYFTRQERHKRRQGCFYYASTDMAALTSIITLTTQQLFSPLKSTVREREKERSLILKQDGKRERERCLQFLSRIMHMHYVTFHYQVKSERTGQLWVRECIRHTLT